MTGPHSVPYAVFLTILSAGLPGSFLPPCFPDLCRLSYFSALPSEKAFPTISPTRRYFFATAS